MRRRSTPACAASNRPKIPEPHLGTEEKAELLPEDDILGKVAELVATEEDVIAILGAGVSTDAGIADYRSKRGKRGKRGRYANGNVFLRSSLSTEDGRNRFLEQAIALRDASRRGEPTKTHKLFTTLRNKGKLLRVYSQNLDDLEAAAGLSTNMTPKTDDPTCVLLHGLIRKLKCELCCSKFDWDDYESGNNESPQDLGTWLRCRDCHARCQERVSKGRRKIAIGRLLPHIVCSDDQDPQEAEIKSFVAKDQRKAKLLIVLGTSLQFYGPRALVRHFANVVRSRGGKVVYVNETKPPKSIAPFFDYCVNWKCDEWTEDLCQRLQWTEESGSAYQNDIAPQHQCKHNREWI